MNLAHSTLTDADIRAAIKEVKYQTIEDRLTLCVMTLANGFIVVGESAVVDPAQSTSRVGEVIAYDKALNKVWEHEAYLLRHLLRHSMPKDAQQQVQHCVNEAYLALKVHGNIAHALHLLQSCGQALHGNWQESYADAPLFQKDNVRQMTPPT